MQSVTHLYIQMRRWVLVGTLLIYISGIIWLLLPPMQLGTLALTPYIVSLSLLALLLNEHRHYEWSGTLIVYYMGCYLATLLVEVMGRYSYSSLLGLQLWHTPLIMGCNWMILLIALRELSTLYGLQGTIRVVVTTLLIVAYNLIIGQIAPLMGVRESTGDSTPITSYLVGGIVCLLLLAWGEQILPNKRGRNRAAIPLLVLQLTLLLSQVIQHKYVK